VFLAQAGQQIETLAAGGGIAGVIEVQKEGVEGTGLESLQDLTRRAGHGRSIALGLEQQPQGREHIGLVVGDQDSRRPHCSGQWPVVSGQSEAP
jgi:hypothetical protein